MPMRKSQVAAAKRLKRALKFKKIRAQRTLFTKSEVEDIRRIFCEEETITATQLAKRFHVSLPTICNVLNGKGAYVYDEDLARCPHGTKLDTTI